MKVCLSLSGGGSNGIVQVGYLKYFQERGIEFEVIVGTSTGALQGAMYAQEEYAKLVEIWKLIVNHKDVYRHHLPLSFVQGIFTRSLYSAAPLRRMINQYVNPDKLITAYQRFSSCSVNLSTQEKKYTTSTSNNRDCIKDFVYASSAFPLAFEPLKYGDEYYWDGGLMEPIPVQEAVRQCPDADLYIIGLTNPVYEKPKKDFGNTLFGFGMRAVESMFQEIWLNDLRKGQERYWSDKKFVILSPDEPPFKSSLEWYPELYDQKIDMGYYIAKQKLEPVL